jgi:hypothetical protein
MLCKHLGLLYPVPDESGRDVPTFVFPGGRGFVLSDSISLTEFAGSFPLYDDAHVPARVGPWHRPK